MEFSDEQNKKRGHDVYGGGFGESSEFDNKTSKLMGELFGESKK